MILLTIIVFLIILGVLIFVHELGHFITARRNGIRADEFGFGFPPRMIGAYKDETSGRYKLVFGNKEIMSENTLYSINLVPLGGFVRIKGENGDMKGDSDSFSSKGAWPRIKVLSAGVIMNFVLAWFLISIGLVIGLPEAVDGKDAVYGNTKIQISEIAPGTPAEQMGIKIGDEVLKNQIAPEGKKVYLSNSEDLQNFIQKYKGKEITLEIQRGTEMITAKGTPRIDVPEGEGPLGISLVETAIKKYPWYEAIGKGLVMTFRLIGAIFVSIFTILKNLAVGQGAGVEVSGPVGIAILTKQVTSLGLIYIIQFAALLSINLGIINAIPFPGLDGGRILFILIEKLKGSPVSQKFEHIFHQVGFFILIGLMIFITFKDIVKIFR